MSRNNVTYILMFVFVLVLLAGCQGDARPTPQAGLSAGTAGEQTAMPEPSPTPTATPEPSPMPTNTRWPTTTPAPTETPTPTVTATSTPLPFPDEAITVENAHLIQPLVTHGRGTIHDFALSPDGSVLAIAASTGVYSYDARSFSPIGIVIAGLATDVVFSSDGERLAATLFEDDSATVYVFRTADNVLVTTFPIDDFDHWVQLLEDHIAFVDPAGALLVVRERNLVRLWDVITGEEADGLEPLRANLARDWWSLTSSPQGRWLASGHTGSTALSLWNTENGYELTSIGLESSPYPTSMAFSSDERLLAVGFSTGSAMQRAADVELWDVETRTLVSTLPEHLDWVSALAFSPDNTLLAASSMDGIRVWDLESGQLVHHLDAARGPNIVYQALAISPDGELLFSSARGQGGISIWHLGMSEEFAVLADFTSPIKAKAFLPDSQGIALKFDSGSTQVWDLFGGEEVGRFDGGSGQYGDAIAISPDGRLLASGAGDFLTQEIIVWDLASQNVVAQFPVEHSNVAHLLFSPDSRFLLSSGADWVRPTVELWDTATWQRVFEQPLRRNDPNFLRASFSFSPDGRQLVAALDWRLLFWNVPAGGEPQTFFEERQAHIWDVAFSPNGEFVVALVNHRPGTNDAQSLVLLDVATRSELARFAVPVTGTPYGGDIFLLDGGRLALVELSGAGSVLLINLTNGEVIHRIATALPVVSPDDRFMVTGDYHGQITVWGVPGEE